MNRGSEQALTSLVPSLSNLPTELIDLATSLLTQSRSKAASLKQEEEVARGYACAHLACERLKTKLNLPSIHARPPCPPRIYKKLYAYLDSALKTDLPRRTSQPPTNASASTPSKARDSTHLPASVTPRKRGRPPSATSTPRKQARGVQQSGSEGLLEDRKYLLPAIRSICHVLGNRAATPHAYTGICSVLDEFGATSASSRSPGPSSRAARAARPGKAGASLGQEQIPALLVVVATIAINKLGGKVPSSAEGLAVTELARHKELEERCGPDFNLNEAQDSVKSDIAILMREAQRNWCGMEWFLNLEPSAAAELGRDEDMPDGAALPLDEADELMTVSGSKAVILGAEKQWRSTDENPNRLRPGLGTMFCPAVDWLSDERCASYEVWKCQILARIENMA